MATTSGISVTATGPISVVEQNVSFANENNTKSCEPIEVNLMLKKDFCESLNK